MSNGTWENRNIQSGAVLWLRHNFARAFSSDSWILLSLREALASRQSTGKESRIMKDSMPLDCFGYRLAMTQEHVIASVHTKHPPSFDCQSHKRCQRNAALFLGFLW